ncbi:MAG: UDP-N-acetylmuramoyl-L-alanine--D-glutamate ligase, partial [Defluviitaleaceae bacterium]|nr:UDP-N-acetylmuramoyl-L-alanine--D-glutamate ligase [Defluviitaleaceae bacterium]
MGEFAGLKVLVCGMARSGQAAARLLARQGAVVSAYDVKPYEDINWSYRPDEFNITYLSGDGDDGLVLGYDLVVPSPGIPAWHPFLLKSASHKIPVAGELEIAYRLCPCPVIAITGTNGKTTVTSLVGEILKKSNPRTVVAGNIGEPFSDFVLGLAEDSVAVVETSSFQLETAPEFKPRVGAVLNVTPDHLDRHSTLAKYASVKERIFRNQTESDYSVLNAGDELCRQMRAKGKKIFFSLNGECGEGVFLDREMLRVKYDGIDETILGRGELK